jgi:enediyne biosynthesis protein E4
LVFSAIIGYLILNVIDLNNERKCGKVKKVTPYIYIIILLISLSCKQSQKEPVLFSLQKNTGITFSNLIQNTPDFNVFSYRNFYNGGGVAIGDINNDGLSDVFFTANMGSNKLYLNKGNFQFDDISLSAGFTPKTDWSTGVVLVDINHDGWLDIFVCNAGYINGKIPQCQLYINNKNLTFTDKAAEYGLTNSGGYTTHAAFFDYDLDGDLDCFIVNNSFIPVNTLNYANKRNLRAPDWPVADFLKGGGDHLYRNDGDKFIDVSSEAGVYGSLISFGLGVTVGDVNGDQYPDVYVSNDFFERDYLYINQRNGTFKDEIEEWTQHLSHSSMGADMGDINNDGFPDIFTTDMLPDDDYRLKANTTFDNIDVNRLKEKSGFYYQYTQNTLQVNMQNNRFAETGYYSGVAASDWSWGGLIFDADNDGLSDIFVCNGIYKDVTNQDFIDFFANDVIQKMVSTGQKDKFDEVVNKMPSIPIPNKLYHNKGNLQFDEVASTTGLGKPSFSNGSAYGDLDNDGDLDLVINNVNQESFVYKNESRTLSVNNYIGFFLKGLEKNTFAVGTRIKVYQGAQVFSRELFPSRGFQSSVDYKQVIGLGKGQADSVIIYWPDKTISKIIKPEINKEHVIQQGQYSASYNKDLLLTPTLFRKIENSYFDKHAENEYIDFYAERNIPAMLSREGPHADTADVNGDGLTDIYIGGASGQPGALYLQTATGFEKSRNLFDIEKEYEDVAVLFLDADNDGDPDLFVGAGGNVQPQGSRLLHHRLYLNDGQGRFKLADNSFPDYTYNAAVAVTSDIDGDGDLDIFVGSRSVPQNYGVVPESVLYINNGKGVFQVAQKLKPGMVTAAVFADVQGDANKELIVVGEWMAPAVYALVNGKAIEITTTISKMKGWWQSVIVTDIDGDKVNDIVLGNIGENFYLQPTANSPVKLWINDFDGNGTVDKIISRTVNKKDVPVFMKRDITDQIPGLKKKNLKFEDYAKKSVQELFSTDSIKNATVAEFNYSSSCVMINKGNGQFIVNKLPVFTQLSSINAIVSTDLNNDGRNDLIVGGNLFYFQPQFSRLDASFGHVLINEGGGQFSCVNPVKSGINVRGEIKNIIQFDLGRPNSRVLILQNDNFPAMYYLNKF